MHALRNQAPSISRNVVWLSLARDDNRQAWSAGALTQHASRGSGVEAMHPHRITNNGILPRAKTQQIPSAHTRFHIFSVFSSSGSCQKMPASCSTPGHSAQLWPHRGPARSAQKCAAEQLELVVGRALSGLAAWQM